MKDISEARNLTLLMDFYELTMARGYFDSGYQDKVGVFDMFFRKIPDDGGFAIAAGLAQFCEVIDNLHFDEGDISARRAVFPKAFWITCAISVFTAISGPCRRARLFSRASPSSL